MKTLIRNGAIVPCAAGERAPAVLEGDVLFDRTGRILAVGSVAPSLIQNDVVRVVDASGCAVLPGLTQAHVHLCQTLFRGHADDLPLLAWLQKRIWPFEAAHDEASLRASAELGLLEMMLAGTTQIVDMGTVHDYDVVFDACARAGIRAVGGKAMMDHGDNVPKRLRERTRASLREADRLRETWSGHESGKLGYAYAPRFILSCTEALFRGAAERSVATGALLHSHVAEHPEERALVRHVLGDDDIAVLRAWGFKGERTLLAHGVQLRDDEADAVAADGTRIVHCPSANLKLGSGIARIHELDVRGVHLALGADGAPCNNNLDPWVELRHAALLAKVQSGPTTMPAARALRLATLDGAKAIGMSHERGSLEVGKRADIVVVRVDGPHAEPGFDAISKLVYACTARDVVHVFIDGEHVVRFGEHQRLDREHVLASARREAKKLVARANV